MHGAPKDPIHGSLGYPMNGSPRYPIHASLPRVMNGVLLFSSLPRDGVSPKEGEKVHHFSGSGLLHSYACMLNLLLP